MFTKFDPFNGTQLDSHFILYIFICRLGVCERYAGQSEICNSVFNMTSDYVYFDSVNNQSQLSNILDNLVPLFENINADVECRDLVRKVVCNFIFAPCGSNGIVHPPRSVCSEECNYVRNVCSTLWLSIQPLISLGASTGFGSINCSATSSHLKPLPTCCFGAGIEIEGITCIYVVHIFDSIRYHELVCIRRCRKQI